MTSRIKRVGDLTDPESFEKAVEEANKNGEVRNSCETLRSRGGCAWMLGPC